MATVAAALVALVAAIHLYILVLEMFLWRTPRGLRAFRMEDDTGGLGRVDAEGNVAVGENLDGFQRIVGCGRRHAESRLRRGRRAGRGR